MCRSPPTGLLVGLLLVVTLAVAREAEGLGPLSSEPPSTPIPQGTAVSLTFRAGQPRPAKGSLLYRAAGATSFQRLPLDFRDDGSAVALVPGTAVVAPGLEYYAEASDGRGRTVTAPAVSPSTAPFRLDVAVAAAGPRLLSPDPQTPWRGPGFSVSIQLPPGSPRCEERSITLFVDETDVTALARCAGDRLTYSTSLVPADGSHRILFSAAGGGPRQSGEWTIPVGGGPGGGRGPEVQVTGGLSFNYGRQLRNPSGTPDTASGNLALALSARGSDWEVGWNGVNLQYVKGSPDSDPTLSAGYTFYGRKGDQRVEYGDITVKENPLVAPGLPRRGAQTKLRAGGVEVHAFDVSSDPVSGWDSGLTGRNQVYGASVQPAGSAQGSWLPSVTYASGRSGGANAGNSAGTEGPSEGEAVGVSVAPNVGPVSVKGEVAYSRYDPDTERGKGKSGDVAGTATVSTAFAPASASVALSYFGTDFGSVANPGFTSDRAGVNATFGSALGLSRLDLGGGWERDNVENDDDLPTVQSSKGQLSWTLSAPPWPTVGLAVSRAYQSTLHEPEGARSVDNTNDAASLTFAGSGQGWNASLGATYGRLDDRSGGDMDSETWGAQLSGGVSAAPSLSLNPAASYTWSKTPGVNLVGRLASLTASTPLWGPYADTSFQVSYSDSKSSDGSQDVVILGGSVRFSLNLCELVKNRFGWGRESLALSADYNRVNDRAAGERTVEIAVYLSLNFYGPIDWAFGF